MPSKPLKLVVATSNMGKLAEFKDALSRLDLVLLSLADTGIESLPAETGASYEENALLKAGFVALRTGLPALADDSGLEVDALGGAPGVYSARFGGPGLSDGERMAHLLGQLRQVPATARGAGFKCVVVLATPGGEIASFAGETRGELTAGPRGEGGFGYDPIFRSRELGKTFAEASLAEKRGVSHRGRALASFLDWAMTPVGKRTIESLTPPREHGQ
ncbi:MAG TPA: RdgB/HAM1 family non-canonical purine NTP pyrophosphatase [Trueperaceae bacterium]|nr:RdgB/HAM1 family non-canonical purine NTP pyrophosphatase [Trueperaceae bacterium]